MNCCDDFGNCTQGRDCPIRNERMAQALKKNSLFWDVMEQLVAMLVLVGIVASLCFLFGYIYYRVTP